MDAKKKYRLLGADGQEYFRKRRANMVVMVS